MDSIYIQSTWGLTVHLSIHCLPPTVFIHSWWHWPKVKWHYVCLYMLLQIGRHNTAGSRNETKILSPTLFMFHNLDNSKFSIWDPNNETYQLKLDIDIRRSNSAWHNHLLDPSKHGDHQWRIIVGLHKYLVVICSNDKSDQDCYFHQDKSP